MPFKGTGAKGTRRKQQILEKERTHNEGTNGQGKTWAGSVYYLAVALFLSQKAHYFHTNEKKRNKGGTV